jgi:DNA repair exonuclease SbcCD nuclease subunit
LCKDPLIVFPGNVQGRHARETGPKGCILSTIRSDHSVEHVFHRLDQVRWERGHVDISAVLTESDALSRTADMLDQLVASETSSEALLAVRVTVSGFTPLFSRSFSDPDRFTAEVRSIATERGGDRLWIEKVELQVQPPREKTTVDGPIDELMEVLEQLRDDRSSLEPVLAELAELKRRLPSELIQDPDGPRLSDADWLQSLLGQVQPFLLDLLMNPQGGTANGGS